ncbi:uncharacterized protein M6B38_100515 [Iris pallida]|uniref:Uncharacterized protein n=1 Tax=Iris pallida TaxID=29817 RepID=A0AAX6IU61_IRIPA|nr:uncharacterized protein M6B38_100515 [Iris pallida]
MGERAAAADDVGDGMQCADHPYRANPGGICAFCLQERLGKLVSSSSSPSSFFPPLPATSSTSVTSSTSSSFRSSSDFPPTSSRILTFLNSNNNKKKQHPPPPPPPPAVPSYAAPAAALSLKRSKSVAPRPVGDVGGILAGADSPRKKSFWSFLSLSSSSSSAATTTTDKRRSTDVMPQISLQQHQEDDSTIMKTIGDQDEESPSGGSQASSSSFGRKVARSRSVGCGSRSFSGDFLERISTGFGDCTLRRVESQRESSKHGGANSKMVMRHHDRESRIKERVKCGGIFGGFGMISASSSSYWLSVAEDDDFGSTSSRVSSNARRNRNWGWAFASPMRAFKPVSASKSLGPANAVASINSSTRGARIGNGNPPSSSLAAVVGS